jgi:hypothetical protein
MWIGEYITFAISKCTKHFNIKIMLSFSDIFCFLCFLLFSLLGHSFNDCKIGVLFVFICEQ